MSAVYDYEPSPQNDPIVSILDNYLRASVAGMALKKIFLLKALPFCTCLWLNQYIDSTQITWKSTARTGVASRFVDQT